MRHAFFEVLAPHHKYHFTRMARKVQRRLACRVSCADQVDVLPMDGVGLAPRRSIEHALADEPIYAFDGETPPCYAGCKDKAARPDSFGPVQNNLVLRRIDTHNGTRDQNLRPQPPCLL